MTAVERIDPRTSAHELEQLDRPAILVGGCAGWPATAWTRESLAAKLGTVQVRAKVSSGHQHPDFHRASLREMFAVEPCTFGELLARFDRPDAARWLFTGDEQPILQRRDGNVRVDSGLSPLLADAPVVALVPPERLYTVWGWFSGAGVRTWLHYDNNGCHNLNAQLTGSKEVTLYSPDDLPHLSPFPPGGANPAHNCCAVDVEDPGAAPGLADATPWTAKIAAGDLLFIPAWWFHTVLHTGAFNANVNVWWKPAIPPMNPVATRQAAIDYSASTR